MCPSILVHIIHIIVNLYGPTFLTNIKTRYMDVLIIRQPNQICITKTSQFFCPTCFYFALTPVTWKDVLAFLSIKWYVTTYLDPQMSLYAGSTLLVCRWPLSKFLSFLDILYMHPTINHQPSTCFYLDCINTKFVGLSFYQTIRNYVSLPANYVGWPLFTCIALTQWHGKMLCPDILVP